MHFYTATSETMEQDLVRVQVMAMSILAAWRTLNIYSLRDWLWQVMWHHVHNFATVYSQQHRPASWQ